MWRLTPNTFLLCSHVIKHNCSSALRCWWIFSIKHKLRAKSIYPHKLLALLLSNGQDHTQKDNDPTILNTGIRHYFSVVVILDSKYCYLTCSINGIREMGYIVRHKALQSVIKGLFVFNKLQTLSSPNETNALIKRVSLKSAVFIRNAFCQAGLFA